MRKQQQKTSEVLSWKFLSKTIPLFYFLSNGLKRLTLIFFSSQFWRLHKYNMVNYPLCSRIFSKVSKTVIIFFLIIYSTYWSILISEYLDNVCLTKIRTVLGRHCFTLYTNYQLQMEEMKFRFNIRYENILNV